MKGRFLTLWVDLNQGEGQRLYLPESKEVPLVTAPAGDLSRA